MCGYENSKSSYKVNVSLLGHRAGKQNNTYRSIKMKKKLTSTLLTLSLVLSLTTTLTACGGESEPANSSNADITTPTTTTTPTTQPPATQAPAPQGNRPADAQGFDEAWGTWYKIEGGQRFIWIAAISMWVFDDGPGTETIMDIEVDPGNTVQVR
jgi:hypothetical protein